MKNRLSLLMALVISASITTTTFAATTTPTVAQPTTAQASVTSVTLTLEDALKNLEASNVQLKLLSDNVNVVGRQLDNDHQAEIRASNVNNLQNQSSAKVQNQLQQFVTPQLSQLKYEKAKNDRDQQLNTLKASLERQYMNALACQDQIATIKSTMANIDKQIAQMEAKIQQGQATSDQVEPLKIQKSQYMSSASGSINLIQQQTLLQQDLIKIKQQLNMDINTDLKLVPIKKDFVKYDDSSIDQTIQNSITNSFSLNQLSKTMELDKTAAKIYSSYSSNDPLSVSNSQLTVNSDAVNLDSQETTTMISLWSAYYTLKGKEDTITTDKLTVESDQMDYDNKASQFASGQTDNLTVDKAALKLQSDKITLQNDINDYMVTIEEFKNQLTQ
jgi:outer membrane protein TolC